jgi:hypothetical protein
MSQRVARIIYWVATLSFVVPQSWNAVLMLMDAPRMTEIVTGLGYPIYFMKLLGCAHLLGALAILALGPGSAIKEWAYAGFTFEMLSASASHLASGEILLVALLPLVFLALLLSSYVAWKRLSYDAPEGSPGVLAQSSPAGTLGRWPYSPRTSLRLRGHA